ncbi:Xaa-Pro peptidase family protein [Patescibacteria group bacterium]|nr:Xaa-Pro peptidase family protein [Patescibacteria group bacterium]
MPAKLIISNSQNDSNMFYATGFLASDDFIYSENAKKKIIYIDDFEFDRAKLEAKDCEVRNYSEYTSGINRNTFGNILINILKDSKIKIVQVPGNLKIKYAKILIENGIEIDVKEPFFYEREIKKDNEIKKITAVQRVNEKAMKKALNIIKKSKIRKDGKLLYQKNILTSEYLKNIINIEFLKNDCYSESNIVSCGKDSAQPHNLGSGPLLANQLIIIDIFPKSKTQRYFADMTRTVVKGKATDEMKKMYEAVLKAQKIALRKIKKGAKPNLIHQKVEKYFVKAGFQTGEKNGKMNGFFHGTGHGVGLNIHELPNIGNGNKKPLKVGNVVTVEPGIYYPEIGGVRIEDLVVVTKTGCQNLTKFPKVLEI